MFTIDTVKPSRSFEVKIEIAPVTTDVLQSYVFDVRTTDGDGKSLGSMGQLSTNTIADATDRAALFGDKVGELVADLLRDGKRLMGSDWGCTK